LEKLLRRGSSEEEIMNKIIQSIAAIILPIAIMLTFVFAGLYIFVDMTNESGALLTYAESHSEAPAVIEPTEPTTPHTFDFGSLTPETRDNIPREMIVEYLAAAITEPVAPVIETAASDPTEPPEITTERVTEAVVEITAKPTEPAPEWISLGIFELTAYCPCSKCNGVWAGMTASGAVPQAGRTIGANTTVLPFGSVVMIDGFGEYTVEDTGGAMKRNDRLLDIFYDCHDEALAFGRQYAEVRVRK
jgi:3D (Asp-Asp-Asp) domain-containing protein